MKFFQKGCDGGIDSGVTGYWLVEIKSLFSIVILRFGKNRREAYHSHAFNALTWWIKGKVTEFHTDGRALIWTPSLYPKYTPRSCYHKIYPHTTTWAFCIRGPWVDKWKELRGSQEVILTHGRRVVDAP